MQELVAAESFEIVVIKDGEKPVISVDFNISKWHVGTSAVLPAATATDNADGEIAVAVTVTKDGAPVALSGLSFAVKEKGIYVIEYAATDAAGNISKEVFEVLAGDKSKSGRKITKVKVGLIVGLSVGGAALLAGAAVFTVFMLKRKKKLA